MFVRWKKRKSQAKYSSNYAFDRIDGKLKARLKTEQELDYTFSAYLVECKRVDGKPRQKVIAFLGSIKSKEIQAKWGLWRVSFYEHVKEKFDKLGIKEQDIQRFTGELVKKVPYPTAEEMQEHKRRMTELHTQYPSLNEM